MINKELLYDIMVKWDDVPNMRSFCDSLSKVIQNKHTKLDVMNIISYSDVIGNTETSVIDESVCFHQFVF